jgi:Asp-tRNA(Asn)/Glu-tRNA(Gln) amidotransferase B subunit
MENKKVDISTGGLEKLLEKSLDNFQEERDLALERYRRQDEQMQSSDDFVLQGKFTVDYLKVAADRSNAIFNLAKLVKDIVHKDDSGGLNKAGATGTSNDAQKAEILKLMKEMDSDKESTKTDS